MQRKRMKSFLPYSSSFGRLYHHHRGSSSPAASPLPSQQASSDVLMEEYMAAAEAIVNQWRPDAKITSLFRDDRAEAREFLAAVHSVHKYMLFSVSAGDSPASKSALVRGQTVLQGAMGRLEKEFNQILAANRDRLDPEAVYTRASTQSSVSDDAEEEEVRAAEEEVREVDGEAAIAMADLRAIAETMISAGYGKECVRVYKVLRKSIFDEDLYRLGFERLAPNSHVHKLDWPLLEIKIRSWLDASHVAVTTLFAGERILLDHVFSGFDTIREAVFVDIVGEAAREFFRFPELVTKSKRSMEKIFRILELYEAVSELSPEIKQVFSFVSTVAVLDQALASLAKLAEFVRDTLAEFEAEVQKQHSKMIAPGGGIHPLTRSAMDYITQLADHDSTLAEIYSEFPFQKSSLHPNFFFDALDSASAAAEEKTGTSSLASSSFSSSSSSSSSDGNRSGVAGRLAWLIQVILCKLDGKAASYRHAGQSYLFLANNLQYIVNRIRHCRLRGLLGEEWVARHDAKARQHAADYERVSWGKVAAKVPAVEVGGAREAREQMRAFVAAVEVECTAQAGWVVADAGMREEVREAVRGMVLPAYWGFYQRWRAAVEKGEAAKLSPEIVGQRLAELFSGSDEAGLGSFSSYQLGSESRSSRSEGSSKSA